jgi:hypothetical protein
MAEERKTFQKGTWPAPLRPLLITTCLPTKLSPWFTFTVGGSNIICQGGR